MTRQLEVKQEDVYAEIGQLRVENKVLSRELDKADETIAELREQIEKLLGVAEAVKTLEGKLAPGEAPIPITAHRNGKKEKEKEPEDD